MRRRTVCSPRFSRPSSLSQSIWDPRQTHWNNTPALYRRIGKHSSLLLFFRISLSPILYFSLSLNPSLYILLSILFALSLLASPCTYFQLSLPCSGAILYVDTISSFQTRRARAGNHQSRSNQERKTWTVSNGCWCSRYLLKQRDFWSKWKLTTLSSTVAEFRAQFRKFYSIFSKSANMRAFHTISTETMLWKVVSSSFLANS